MTHDSIWRWLDKMADRSAGDVGAPVCVSVNLLDSQTLGILILGSGERAVYRRWRCLHPVHTIVQQVASVLPAFAADPNAAIPWGSSLGKLASDITAMAGAMMKEQKGHVSWLLLAMPSELSALPWQLLFRCVSKDILVSLVPNLSWLPMAKNPRPDWRAGITARITKAKKLCKFRQRLEGDTGRLAKRLGSVALVFGHGVAVPEAPAICFADRPLWVEQWLELAEHKFCIVHSCSAALGQPSFWATSAGFPESCSVAKACCYARRSLRFPLRQPSRSMKPS